MKLLNIKRSTPYPTIQVLLREIAGALDTKSYISDKHARKLDDSCIKVIDIHVSEFESLKEYTVIKPVRDVFGDEIAARVEIYLNIIVERYFKWIEEHPLDGVSVSQSNKLFSDTNFFPKFIISNFLQQDIYKQKLCLPTGTDLE
jgi:hypothetical protein